MSDLEAPKIAVIGGGTGTFTLLKDLKDFTPNISALVNMSDDGGSSGRLRDEHGVLPPGDVRQCLVALSNTPEVRDLFSFRFGDGALNGHSLGNVILAGLELQYKDFNKALKVASSLLSITGEVLPMTLENHSLTMSDGAETVRGEYIIGHRHFTGDDQYVWLEPGVSINPAAQEAIHSADIVTIAPGNLFGSLLPALAVSGVKEAINETSAKVVAVSNLVTKPGQTDGWHVADYVNTFERYIGVGAVDAVLFNDQLPSQYLLEKYAADGEYPVNIDESRFSEIGAVAIGTDLMAGDIWQQDTSDKTISRTLIRHDGKKVSQQLMQIYNSASL